MKINEPFLVFVCRQLIRNKIDQKFNFINDNNISKPNFKSYLKLLLVNKYPFIFRYKTNKKFNKEKNKIKPKDLIKIDKKILDSYETFAFDIFDTIIYRNIPPESIKDLVSKFIAKESKTNYLRVRHLRFESEVENGQKNIEKNLDSDNKYNEVIELWLEKLKKEFPLSFFPSIDDITKYELLKETESQFTKKSIINFLQLLKNKNKKIIFISDFYFDSKVIFNFLKHLGCDHFFKEGYCSSEYLLTKKSGQLYKKLISENKISPNKTIMIGDNPYSDNESAQKYGIKSYLLYDVEQKYKNYKLELTENLRKQNIFFEGSSTEELISNILKPKKNYDYNLGLLLSPLYISFVEKIIDYCEIKKIKKIYFLSREGKTFLDIFKKINTNSNLKSKYLVASRKSTFLMSIENLNTDELDRIWKQYSNETPKQLLTNLNLPSKLLTVFEKNNIKKDEIIDNNYNYKKLNTIFSDKEFNKIFTKEKNKQLNYFNNYLKTIDLNNSEKIALVDIGWKGSIQDNLAKIIKNEIHGLYLGYFKGFNNLSKNNKKEGLIVNYNSNWYEKNLFKNGSLFEMSTTQNEGSCIHYDKKGPVTKQYPSEKENYKKYFSKTQKAIRDYTDIYIKYKDLLSIDQKNSHHFPLDKVIRFILYPNKTEAKSFLRYSHVESFGVKETSRFNYKFRWKYIFSDINPIKIIKRLKQNFYNQFWINGILKRINIPLTTIIFNLKNN